MSNIFLRSNSQADRKIVIYLFAAALAIHLVYLSQYAKSPFFWVPQLDSLYHDMLAKQIAAGHPVAAPYFRAPLYYYALGGVYRLFGHSFWAARIVQAAIGSLSCVLTYRLGRNLFGPAVGLIAGCAMALYGPLVFNDGELHTPVLEVVLDISFLLCALEAYRSERRILWLAAGTILGLSAIVRPNILIACLPTLWLICHPDHVHTHSPLAAGLDLQTEKNGPAAIERKSSRPQTSLRDWRQTRRASVIAGTFFLIGAFLIPGLVTLRNDIVGHDPVFIASQGGINFYLGNRPGADGFNPSTPFRYRFAGPYEDSVALYGQRAAEDALGKALTPSQAQNYWYGQSLRWWHDDPIAALKLAGKKWVLAWTHQEIRNNVAFDYVRKEWTPALWFLFVGFWLAGPLGIVGMILTWKYGPIARYLTAFTLLYFAGFAAFFDADRYRLPMIPVLLIFGAYAAVWAGGQAKMRHWGALVPAGLCLTAAFVFVNVDWFRTVTPATWAQDYWSAGIRYEAQGRLGAAEVQDRRASALDPGNAEIWSRLGETQYYQRDLAGASASFATAIHLDPQNPSAYYNLALCDESAGRDNLAGPLLVRAAAIDPTYQPARSALAAIAHSKRS